MGKFATSETRKIFVIGLPKTGTTSLSRALIDLGYRTIYSSVIATSILNKEGNEGIKPFSSVLKNYDAFSDWPVCKCYKMLDKFYPKSKFILTTRDPEERYHSMVNHYKHDLAVSESEGVESLWNGTLPRKRNDILNCNKHLNSILLYFKNRQNDLLVINVCEGEGWSKLCPFLGHDIPDANFPKVNTKDSILRYDGSPFYLDSGEKLEVKTGSSFRKEYWKNYM